MGGLFLLAHAAVACERNTFTEYLSNATVGKAENPNLKWAPV